MLRGQWRDQTLGSGTDAWKYWAELRAGNITQDDWCDIEDGIARSHGHCMTMGTASTMTAVTETLGLSLTGSSSIPASDARHWRMAAESGRQIVENAWTNLNPSKFLTKSAFHNSIVADMAVGGSTNAIVHIIAMAGRAGIKLPLDDFDAISRKTPRLADLRPAGRFLMEDFYFAGGLPALLKQVDDLLDGTCMTVNGKSLGENISDAQTWNEEVIRPRSKPLSNEGGTAVLRGNICPNGAVIKHSAMEPKFLKHTGKAVVFNDYEDLAKRLDDPSLDITADSIMVLRSAGPIGAPGMPEWGMLPLPKRLLESGVRDILRMSDARMSGTSYGACILHVAPESAVGGPLALVRTGDTITLDVPARSLTLNVSDEELAKRKADWKPAPRKVDRGYLHLFLKEVTQADEGCDFRFLHHTGTPTPEPRIH
jgi:dihydroxy-acid dehydratase